MEREKSNDLRPILDVEDQEELASPPGIIALLGELKPASIITEEGIAYLFKRHVGSVKRAIGRGELPPPCRLFGSNAWTVGAIIAHIESRLAEAVENERQFKKKIARL